MASLYCCFVASGGDGFASAPRCRPSCLMSIAADARRGPRAKIGVRIVSGRNRDISQPCSLSHGVQGGIGAGTPPNVGTVVEDGASGDSPILCTRRNGCCPIDSSSAGALALGLGTAPVGLPVSGVRRHHLRMASGIHVSARAVNSRAGPCVRSTDGHLPAIFPSCLL